MSTMVQWDPIEEMRSLQKQLFSGDWLAAPFKQLNLPTTDVYTNDDKELVIEAHMPNFAEKDVDVHIENNALIIRAEKHEKEEDKKKKYVVRESSESFYRSVRLPKHADQDNINADIKDGVLTVKVPFKELPKPKKIAITAGKSKK